MTDLPSLLDLVSEFDEDIEDELRAVISRGDDIHQRNNLGYSLLMFAAMSGQSMAARVLLEAGADPNETHDESITPLSMFTKGFTPFLYSVTEGIPETMQLMLEHGADINTQNSLEHRALYLAAGNGEKEKLIILLKFNPELDHKDYRGNTAVMSAVECGHLSCVRLLCEAGAKLDNITKNNKNIIELADTDEIKAYLEEQCKDIDFNKLIPHTQTANEIQSTEEVLTMLDSAHRMMRHPILRYWYITKRLITGK